MTKALIPIVIVITLLIGFVVSIPAVNDLSAKRMERQLLDVCLPDDTEIVESLSKAGKLVGNGNGMQYFGAMLIKSEQTLEELSAYYSDQLTGAVVKKQKTQQIQFLNRNISFEAPMADAESYYIVYLFGNGIAPFSHLDLRGH